MPTWYMNKVPYTGNAVRDAWGTGYGKNYCLDWAVCQVGGLCSNLQFLRDGFWGFLVSVVSRTFAILTDKLFSRVNSVSVKKPDILDQRFVVFSQHWLKLLFQELWIIHPSQQRPSPHTGIGGFQPGYLSWGITSKFHFLVTCLTYYIFLEVVSQYPRHRSVC